MKSGAKILVTGAGGSAATGFIRSLRESPERFQIVGIDCNRYYLLRSEADESYLSPPATDPLYIDFLNYLIEKKGIDLLFAQPDVEVLAISDNREKIEAKTFLPSRETVRVCQDKYESWMKWRRAGVRVPETRLLKTMEDVDAAFEEIGSPLWVRARMGAFGRGSLLCQSPDEAKAWIGIKGGWEEYLIAGYLPGGMLTWQSIWYDGELIVAQGRGRKYWEFANRSPSGVTGLTGCGYTVSSQELDRVAISAIRAIDKRPHGIYGVDCTCDEGDFPNPTEINIGRFFTTHHFFTRGGLNMPYIYVKLALEGEPPPIRERLNPLEEGLAWVRGMDILPILTHLKVIEKGEEEFKNLMLEVKKGGGKG